MYFVFEIAIDCNLRHIQMGKTKSNENNANTNILQNSCIESSTDDTFVEGTEIWWPKIYFVLKCDQCFSKLFSFTKRMSSS